MAQGLDARDERAMGPGRRGAPLPDQREVDHLGHGLEPRAPLRDHAGARLDHSRLARAPRAGLALARAPGRAAVGEDRAEAPQRAALRRRRVLERRAAARRAAAADAQGAEVGAQRRQQLRRPRRPVQKQHVNRELRRRRAAAAAAVTIVVVVVVVVRDGVRSEAFGGALAE